LLDGEPGIAYETAHRECVDWIVTWNGQDPLPIRHYDVFALARDPEPGFLQGSHSIEVIDARNLGQGLHRDLDFANFFTLELLFNYSQVFSDRVPNILERLWLRSSLRPAARQPRHRYAETFVGFVNCNLVFHGTSVGKYSSPSRETPNVMPLTGRRRAKRDEYQAALPLGAPVERLVRLVMHG
jgi:hypothetical protein